MALALEPGVHEADGQVARHVPYQISVADQKIDLRRVLGQEQRCLPGRVAASQDRHRRATTQLRLHEGSGVVDARSLELFEARHIELAVVSARRD